MSQAHRLLEEDPETVIAQHPDQIRDAIDRAEAAGRDAWAATLEKAYDWATEGSDDA